MTITDPLDRKQIRHSTKRPTFPAKIYDGRRGLRPDSGNTLQPKSRTNAAPTRRESLLKAIALCIIFSDFAEEGSLICDLRPVANENNLRVG
jgi:hypothetical protein